MADPKLPDINDYVKALPFDSETQKKLFYAFYDTDPYAAFSEIKEVPKEVRQKLFEIRGKAEHGESYNLEDIYALAKPSKKGAGIAEEEKPKEEWVGPKEALREREFKATTAIPVVGKSPEVSPTPFAKKKEVEVDFFGRPVQSKTSKAALSPKLVKLEKPKPGAAKEAPEEGAPVPATAPPPVVAESKTAEPTAPLLSREEMESRYVNYIKEQGAKAEEVTKGKAAKEKPVKVEQKPQEKGETRLEWPTFSSLKKAGEYVVGQLRKISEQIETPTSDINWQEKQLEALPSSPKEIEEALAQPIIRPELLMQEETKPREYPEGPIESSVKSFAKGALEAVGGMTTPANVALLMATRGASGLMSLATSKPARVALSSANAALWAYFTKEQTSSAYKAGKEGYESFQEGDYKKAAEKLGLGTVDALFALMGMWFGAKKIKEGAKTFKEGYETGQRRAERQASAKQSAYEQKLKEDFEPVPGEPGVVRPKSKSTAPAAGELPAAGEPKPATAKERSIIEYYKEDPAGVYSKLTGDIEKKTAELAQASRYKDSNKNKIKKLGKELDALNKQKALIDRLRQGEEVEQPVAPPPVVTTEPVQPPLAISAEPPPVVEEAPVVEPPPVVEPKPAAAEPVKAAVEPTVKPTVAETFSTPGGAKITDITQTSPEGFTPGIDYIPETDFIFDVEGIGKFTVIPSSEKPGSFAIWPEGDVAPAAVVEGANAKEAFTSFIDKPAPEVKVEAPVTPTGATEAPPAPGVAAPTTKPPVEEPKPTGLPGWAREAIDRNFAQAQRMGIVDRIAELSAEGLTARQVYERLPELEVKTSNNPEKDTIAVQDAVTIVRSVRGKLGIPSMDDRTAFNAWRESYLAKKKPPVEEPKAATEAPPPVAAAVPPMPAPAPSPIAPLPPESTPSQSVPPEPIKPPVAPKPPVESPKVATEPPQEYIPGTDGEVYVWMDYIGSDGKLSRKPTLLGQVKKSEVANLLQRKGRKLPQNMRIYLTGKVLPGSVIAKPDKNTPYRDINKSYIEDIMRASYRDEGEPGYKERLASEIQKLQSLFDAPATVPAEKPKGGTGKKTKKGEAPVPESPAEPAPTQPQPPVELTPKPPVTPSEPGGGPVAVKEKAPKQVEPSEKEIQQEERALEIIPLSELPKKSFRLSEKEEDKSNRVVTTYNGDTWHTNYHVLVKGEPPKYWDKDTIANKSNLGLNQILPDSSSKFKPVEPMAYKYWQKKDESGKTPKLVPSRAVIMSDGGAIDADYYRYIVDTVKPDSWQRGKQDGSYAAYKNGQPVAVVMNLRGVGQYSKESLASALKNRSNFRQKQTWEMSESELLKRQSENPGNPEYDKATRKHDSHAEIVSKAILSGKPVPEYVVEGMGGKFFYVSNPIYEKLYPNGSEQFEAKEAFRNKSKPIVLDYLERLREGENPGDIYEFVKSKLEPGPNPPGFTPAPPELPKPKDKPAAESKKSPAKASEEIKADDIEEIGISGEGEIEFAYKGKRYQASPIFDGKGYRFYDMESGKNIGEFKKSSYLEDPKEALAEILDADRQLKELSGDAETPEVKPEKSEVAPAETPKIQTKYIEPETPQYRKDDNLIALKLRSDRNPVIWMNQKSKLNIFEALERNGIRGFDPTSLGTNFNKASNFYSLLDAVLAKPVGIFKGSQKQRDLLVALRDAMQEARAFSVLNGKDGGVSLINVDSPGREVLISPESYKAFESKPESVKKFHRIFKVGAVGDLIRTFRHENVHAEMSTAVKSIPKADMGTLFKNPSIVEFSSILQRKGYSGADPYTVINELTAHVLTGDFDFFSSNGMTAESLVNAYSVVRPYILAIDKDAVVRAERFKKPGLKISESEPAKLSGTAEQTFSPNLNEITGAMFSTQPPPGRSVKPKANVQSNDLIEEVVKTTEEQQNFLDKVIESTYGKYSPKQQSLLEKIVEQQLSIPKERGESEMSTRIPLSKKAKEDAAKDVLVIGLNSIAENPKMLNTVIEKMTVARDKEGKKIYHGLSGLNLAEGDPIKSAKQIMDRMVDNLLWLHDKMPKEQRDRAKLWYDGANKLINKWSKEYSADPQAVAGVIAVLSPQKDWYQNAEMARKILEAYKKRSSLKWNPKMDEFLFSKDALVEDGEIEGLKDEGASIEDVIAKEERIKKSSSNFYKAAQKIKGKDFNELTSTYEKAVWLRAYDEVTSDRSFRILLPEGKFGDIAVIESGKNKGQRMKMAWQSYAAIEKAIDIMENDSYENISEKLGTKHKVRNFYNNMLFPNSKNGHVTIDTHAVAAALLQPLSSSNVEVNDNFGGISSASTGSQGTYGLIAEAYRKAAAKRGLLAREMQSITWEAVRGLFEAKFKQQDSNKKAINDIWNKMEESKKSDINKIREEILKTAGGMRKPSWVGQGLRTAPPPKKK